MTYEGYIANMPSLFYHFSKKSIDIATMKELMEAGKIRYWGISEADEDTIRRAHAICPLTAIQNRYSMMYRDYETLFPVLEELNISLVAFSPLANGLLSDAYNKDVKFTDKDDFRTRMPQFTPEAYDANQELMEMIRTISKEKIVPQLNFH